MAEPGLVLVTGGSGYIAGFCIAQLLEQGFRVRTTLRNPGRAAEIRATLGQLTPKAASIEVVGAELTADAGWAQAVAGCDYVLHVASPLPTNDPKDDDELVKPARDGALRVLRAARDAGVKRVVMTASVAAIAYGHGGRETPFTEADWSDATVKSDSSAYERSKTLAERAAWDFVAREGGALELVTVNPGAVLGPVLGPDFSSSLEIMKKLLDGSLPGLPRFGWPIVDVRDIADLHLRAMNNPVAAGQRYIGTARFMWMTEVASIVRAGMPEAAKRVPSRKLPDFVLRLVGLFDPIVRTRLFELGQKRDATAAKARAQLGWVTRPVEQTILDCARSLVATGVIKF